MVEQALGLIETRGFVAAVEAADVALKAARVTLLDYELTTGGWVLIKLSGEVAAVQSAVQAGSEAARRVGEVAFQHVIPRPHSGLQRLYPKTDSVPASTATRPKAGVINLAAVKLQDLTVVQLRRLARTIPSIPLKGREISRADKSTLIRLLKRAMEER